ncbi:MAG: type IX secretion system membrane protein PorP/SprF [Flavobacteriales bacterium]|nr:type IX secretion system membrane protein PorP/SprF [Flavobacteriales bacterium]
MKIIRIIILLLACQAVSAQQLAPFSQYMLNPYSINPAVSGTEDFYQMRLNYRNQWAGLDGAPTTYYLSYYGRKPRNLNTGLGVIAYSDNMGPTKRSGFQGSYTHHLKLNDSTKLALGLGLGMINFSINTNDIYVKDKDDLLFTSGKLSSTQPDASFGMYLYNPKYYIGVSIQQLMQSELNWPYAKSKMSGHKFIMAGYRFKVKQKLVVEPSILVRHVTPVPVQIDAGLTFDFMDRVKFGAQYRTDDAISVIVGYNFKRKMYFGYSYDFTTSELKNYSSGTHEILLGYRFVKYEEEEESQMTY